VRSLEDQEQECAQLKTLMGDVLAHLTGLR
jgi:hypothetical protein